MIFSRNFSYESKIVAVKLFDGNTVQLPGVQIKLGMSRLTDNNGIFTQIISGEVQWWTIDIMMQKEEKRKNIRTFKALNF